MKKLTLKEKVYMMLLDSIVSGEYTSDQVLNEQELINKFGVSKSPVREALLVLCNEGILQNIPRYGYKIHNFTISNIRDILEYRLVLESYCIKKSFKNISEENINALRSIEDLSKQEQDVWYHWNINTNFHLTLASFSGNEYIYNQLEKSMNLLKIAYAQFYYSKWNSTSMPNDLKNHSQIISGLEEKDLEKVLLHLKYDLQDFCVS